MNKKISLTTNHFFLYTGRDGQVKINVMLKDETVWLPQKLMATLFDVSVPTISKHLSNVFRQGELALESTVRKSRTVQQEGNRQIKRITGKKDE